MKHRPSVICLAVFFAMICSGQVVCRAGENARLDGRLVAPRLDDRIKDRRIGKRELAEKPRNDLQVTKSKGRHQAADGVRAAARVRSSDRRRKTRRVVAGQ